MKFDPAQFTFATDGSGRRYVTLISPSGASAAVLSRAAFDGEDGGESWPVPLGPTGPTGPTGAAGSQGIQGPAGQDGEDAYDWPNGASPLVSGNPTASLGLSAVNGTATTWMRSDAAPALSQSITPTWTGKHIHNEAMYVNSPTLVAPSPGLNTPFAVMSTYTSSGAVGTVLGQFTQFAHVAGAHTITDLYGQWTSVAESVGTATTMYGSGVRVLASGGTVTLGIGVDIERAQSTGTFTTGIGLRIRAVTGTIGTDIAIQSLGGQNRFVGSVKIGADSAPATELDVAGVITVSTGFRQGTMTAGRVLRSDGTNLVTAVLDGSDITSTWNSYTPTVTQGGTVTSFSVNTARYVQVGKTVHLNGVLIVNNAGTAAGANDVSVSLPVNFAFPSSAAGMGGTAQLYDSSADILYPASIRITSATSFKFVPVDQIATAYGAGGLFLGSLRFTAALATSDQILFNLTYEAA